MTLLVNMVPLDTAQARAGEKMSCNHPLNAFWTGTFTDTGKKDYFISSSIGDIVSVDVVRRSKRVDLSQPIGKYIDGRFYLTDPLRIPCGHCVGCRMKRAKQWQIRLVHEAELYPDRTFFVTLTYDPWHLPINFDGEPYLSKRHCQLFLKRLRRYSGKRYRYFLCGEMGEETHRPHYHLILFGDLDDLIPFKFNCFHSDLISKCWPYGLHEISPAEKNSMAYVAGYVEKKQRDPCFDDYPVKPFVLMSTKPMLGSNHVDDVECNHRHVFGNFGNSHYAPVPRAYFKKHENKDWYESFKAELLEASKQSELISQAVYKTTNKEKIGDIKDSVLEDKLEKVRISKI